MTNPSPVSDSTRPIRVAIYQPRMCPGGAQQVTLTLFRNLDRDRFAPILVIRESEGEWMSQVPQDVPIYALNTRVRFAWIKLARLLRTVSPDVVLSMSSGGNLTVCAGHFFGRVPCPLVLAEHNTFSQVWNTSRWKLKLMSVLKNVLYRRAERVIAVSSGVAEDLVRTAGIQRTSLVTIHNPIVDDKLQDWAKAPVEHPWFAEDVPIILAAGRLVRQKDYPMLLEAFARVRRRRAVRLVILGDGDLRGELEVLARELAISGDVAFLGFVENPFAYMRRSTVFALSSRFEGFGNVLVEAMACGVPVVSTDCPSGPNEIISHGENGLLVPVGDAEAMADAIDTLLDDQDLRDRIRDGGRKRSAHFSAENAVLRYEELLAGLTGREWAPRAEPSWNPSDGRAMERTNSNKVQTKTIRRPNFFIVGAPKCGTTSLYEYLREHPDVFMPDRKEPAFFCTDFYKPHHHRLTQDEYLSLFQDAGSEERRIGEASTWYLYSDRAREGIKEFSPDARIIIMLRNPVNMMYSLHAQRLWNMREDIRDFEVALEAEEERKRGLRLPPYPFPTRLLFYRDLGRYSHYVNSYIETFGRDNVLVLVFEDFVERTEECYREVCEFLGIDTRFRPSFEVHNAHKRLRSVMLKRLMRSPLVRMARVLPRAPRETAKRALLNVNKKVEKRSPMPAELRSRLEQEFAAEIARLGEILDRDLTPFWSGRVTEKPGSSRSENGPAHLNVIQSS